MSARALSLMRIHPRPSQGLAATPATRPHLHVALLPHGAALALIAARLLVFPILLFRRLRPQRRQLRFDVRQRGGKAAGVERGAEGVAADAAEQQLQRRARHQLGLVLEAANAWQVWGTAAARRRELQ